MTTSTKNQEADKFGTARFNAIKTEILKLKLSKDIQRRLDKVVSVFSYRTSVAHDVARAEAAVGDWRSRYTLNAEEARLANFKPVSFFLDSIQAILDDAKKEIAAEEAEKQKKKEKRYANW